MHEMAIAVALVERVEAALRHARATRAIAVHVRVGALCGVVPEALALCFPDAACATLGDVALHVELVPVELRCRSCGVVALADAAAMICAGCGATDVEVLRGRDLELTRVEVR